MRCSEIGKQRRCAALRPVDLNYVQTLIHIEQTTNTTPNQLHNNTASPTRMPIVNFEFFVVQQISPPSQTLGLTPSTRNVVTPIDDGAVAPAGNLRGNQETANKRQDIDGVPFRPRTPDGIRPIAQGKLLRMSLHWDPGRSQVPPQLRPYIQPMRELRRRSRRHDQDKNGKKGQKA